MQVIPQKFLKITSFLCALLVIGFLFQNATVVDFTKDSKKMHKPSALELAIAKSDSDHSKGKKELGLHDKQIEKKYIRKQRGPNSVMGDLTVEQAEKDKKQRKKLRRQAK